MTGMTRLFVLAVLLGLTSAVLLCAVAAAQTPPAPPPTIAPIDGEPAELHDVAVQLEAIHIKGKPADARAICEARLASATDPEHRAYFLWYIGRTYAKEKAYDRAIDTYKQVLAQYPQSQQVWWARYYLGRAYHDKVKIFGLRENLPLAAAAFDQLLKDYPNHKRIWRPLKNLAECYEELGNDQGALAAYQRLIDLEGAKPSSQWAVKGVRLLGKMRRWDDAIALAQAHIASHPSEDLCEVHIALSQSYTGKGEAERAAAEMEIAKTQYPATYARWRAHDCYDKAVAANSAGDRMTSVQMMAVVVKEPGWDKSLYFPLTLYSLWCRYLGESGAREWFNEAIWASNMMLQLKQNHEQELILRAEIAYFRQGLGQHEEAIAELRAVLAEQPADQELVENCRKWLAVSVAALAGAGAAP